MTDVDVRVVMHHEEVRAVTHDVVFGDRLMYTARATVVADARALAPMRRDGRTRGGAASIHGELVLGEDGYEVRVTWDAAHDYMRFPERGTRYIRGQHFMRRAAQAWASS